MREHVYMIIWNSIIDTNCGFQSHMHFLVFDQCISILTIQMHEAGLIIEESKSKWTDICIVPFELVAQMSVLLANQEWF